MGRGKLKNTFCLKFYVPDLILLDDRNNLNQKSSCSTLKCVSFRSEDDDDLCFAATFVHMVG